MVLSKTEYRKLKQELDSRIGQLRDLFESRELKTSSEGAGRGSWKHPETMCSTVGSATDIRIAIADFKTILSEIGRLK
jgi:hypothetical protein